jgi:energy-coupling factor transporter transmembrane protein EcfT
VSASPSLYVDGDTLLHRLTARSKLALLTGVFVAAYAFDHPAVVAVPLVASFLALLWAGGWRNFRRLAGIVAALFVVGLLVWPSFTPAGGPVVLDLPFIEVTERELLFALGRSERIAAFIVGGLIFVTTTTNEEIVAGLRALGLPYAFCFAVGTALRLFPTFLGATGTVRQAQAARGHDVAQGGPLERLRNFVPLLIPVFMTAIRNVQTQSMALEARGCGTRGERTFYDRRTFAPADWAVTAFGLALTVASVVLALQGFGTV